MDLGQLGPAALIGIVAGTGAPIWAAAIMFIIETLKQVAGTFLDGKEKVTAFILSALLTAASYQAALATAPPSIELSIGGLILALLAWFNIARLAMALHDDKESKPGSLTSA